MTKEFKKTIKFFKKNRGLILKTIIPVVIFCLLLTIIGILLPKPNDNITPSNGSYLFENRNPRFNVGFGSKDNPDTSYVRFEAKSDSRNPFDEEKSNLWNSFTRVFTSKKGFEFGLSEIRFSETDSEISKKLIDQIGSAIEQMEVKDVKTGTEVVEVGRLLGEEDENDISKKTVLNKDVYPGVDVEYQILENLGVKEEIIIQNIDEYTANCGGDSECLLPLNEFVFDLRLDEGVSLKRYESVTKEENTPTYYLVDSKDKYIAHFLPTFAVDGVGSKTYAVDLVINHIEENSYEVVVTLDIDWLFNSDRVFPIRIDPSIVHDTTTEFDTGSDYNTEVITGPKVKLEEAEIDYTDSNVVGYWKFDEDWYDVNWLYRQPITVDNSDNTTNLSNYQVSITVDTASLISANKMQSDCDDIRFTDSDETTLIDYWIVSGCNTASTEIWVEVPSISASSTKTIYMYYDNTIATAGSDPEATLDMYATFQTGWEGFSTLSSYGYGYARDSGQGNPSPSARILEGSGCRLCSPSQFCELEGAIYQQLSKPSGVGYCVTLDYRAQSNYSSSGVTNFRLGFVNTSNNSCIYNSYFVKGGTYDTGWKYNQTKCTTNVQSLTSVRILFGMHDAWSTDWNEQSHVDNIKLRKYTSPEPTTSVGTEESGTYLSGEQNAIKDSSGNDNHGIPTGTTYVEEGKLGGAREFNGSSEYIYTGGTNLPTGDFTFDMWLKPDSFSANQAPVMISNTSGQNELLIQVNTTGTISVLTNNASQVTTSNTLTVDEWNHLVVTRSSGSIKVYINNVEDPNTGSDSGTLDFTGCGMLIGADSDSGCNNTVNDWFNGSIDEVRVSDVARTDDEIERLYQIGYEQKIQGAHTSASIDMGNSAEVENISWTSVGDDTGDGELPYSTTGLVGQWNFNESSGTTADNEGSCGSSCDGTLTNFSDTTGQDVVAGSGWTSDNRRWGEGGLMFDGSDDYVSISNNSSLNPTDAITIEYWMKTSNGGMTLNKGNFNQYYTYVSTSSGQNSFRVFTSAGNLEEYSNSSFWDGRWHHFTATWSNSDGKIRIYKDGVLDSISDSSLTGTLNSQTNILSIGSGIDTPDDYFFEGVLDGVRIYSRALSPTEILSNYQSGNIEMRYRTSDDGSTWSDWYGGIEESVEGFNNEYLYDTDDSGLVAYYPMDESSGTSVEDVSSNTNDGTASGTVIVDGKHGNSRGFDGSDDYIELSQPLTIFDKSFTVSMWVYFNDDSRGILLGDYQRPNAINVNFEKLADRKLRLYWGGSPDIQTSTNVVNLNEWQFVSFVRDKTNSKVYFYVNGNLVYTYDGSLSDKTTSGLHLIGRDNRTGATTVDGSLDEVRISNTALSSSEIHNQWLEGSSNPSIVRTESISNSIEGDNALSIESNGPSIDNNTVGYWKLDEDTSADMNDGYPSFSGWSNTATSSCGSYTMMGGYNTFAAGDYTEKTISNLPAGTYMVAFNYYHVDSWDGESGRAFWNGNQIWSRSHTLGGTQICGGSWGDSNGLNYDMVYVTVNHTGGNATLRFDSTLNQGGTDESWGVDNISVSDFSIEDKSVYSNDGATMGSTTYLNGRSGKARNFDGSNDHVIIDSNFGLGTSEATIESWIYLDSISTSGAVVKIGADGTYGYGIGVGGSHWASNGNDLILLYEGIRWMDTGVQIGTGWHHIAMVLDSTGNPSAYIDGELVYTNDQGPPTAATLNKTTIGGYTTSGSERYFQGVIDEVCISNSSRSQREIYDSYNFGKDKYISRPIVTQDLSSNTTLPFWIASDEIGSNMDLMYGESEYANYEPDENTVGYWSMDKEGPESQVSDLSGNGNHGVLNPNGFLYTRYDNACGSHPTTHAALINCFNEGSLYHKSIQTSSQSSTNIADDYTSMYSTWMYVSEPGSWLFAIDGDDAVEIEVDGTVVASYYDGHGFSGGQTHNGSITLDKGWYKVNIRHEEVGGGDGVVAYVRPPGVGTWSVFNTTNVSGYATLHAYSAANAEVQLSQYITGGLQSYPSGSFVEGVIGDARSFNGSSDYVNLGDDSSLGPTDLLTVDFWIKTESTSGGHIVDRHDETSGDRRGYIVYLVSDGRIMFSAGSGGSYPAVYSTESVNDGKWHHVVSAFSANTLDIYIDGKLSNTETSGVPSTISSPTRDLILGRRDPQSGYGPDRYFNGGLDEVRISDIARTPDEIRQAYEIGRRTHPIKVDFKADLESSNLITGDSDKSFTISEQDYGTTDHIDNIDVGEKIVVKENVDGTQYIAQGDIDSVNTSTGAVTVSSWDSDSTFPTSGFTTNATVFKWQREYIDVRSPLDEDINQVSRLTFRKTTDVPAIFWIDDVKKAAYMEDGNIGNTEEQVLGFNDDVSNRDSILKMEGDRSLSLSDTEVYSKNTFTANDISGYDKLPFWIASDQKGKQTSLLLDGSTDYANYIPDTNTVGYWKMDDSNYQQATGGTITYADGYTIHTFTSDGTFVVTEDMEVDVLVVAGGGGGGKGRGGGGGAGGVIYESSFVVSEGDISVTVGEGGAGSTSTSSNGSNGENSAFSTLTAIGGGGGESSDTTSGGSNGGSGGGANLWNGPGGSGVEGQGHDGGSQSQTWETNKGAGGGGGAGAVGGDGADNIAGNGGTGEEYDISGASTYYGGGGGGSSDFPGGTAGSGGNGGGGDGGIGTSANGYVADGEGGDPNTGGGGGGGSRYSGNGATGDGGDGGSGIVIVRYYTGAEDSSENNNIGIMLGTTSMEKGRLGRSREFNGSSDYIFMSYNPILNPSVITAETWIKTDNSSMQTILTQSGCDNDQSPCAYSPYRLRTESGYLKAILYNDSSTSVTLTSPTVINDDNWHHVGFSFGNGAVNLYVDGKIVASNVLGGTMSQITNDRLFIGATWNYSAGITNNFSGIIDEVRISNVARTPTEIYESYNIGKRRLQPEIKFKADLQSSNLITDSNDKSFDISETAYDTTDHIENLESGDKIIITESTYKAQGTIDTVNTSTGAVTIGIWDEGSTFPSGGYTTSANVFKWQKEYLYTSQVDQEYLTSLDQITMITSGQANIWYDDVRAGEEFAYIEDAQYLQYQPIFTKWDDNPLLDLYLTEVDITYTAGPTMDQVMRHGKWFNSSGEKQPFWWVGEH